MELETGFVWVGEGARNYSLFKCYKSRLDLVSFDL